MKELRLYITKLFLIAYALLMIASCDEKKQFDGYLYPIRENGLYGYIDSVGNRIIEPEYLWVSTFHNGLAMAVVDTIYRIVPDSMAYEVGERDTIINVYRMYAKYGYIDKAGKFAIAPRFVSYVNMNEIGNVTNEMDDCSHALYRHSFRNGRAMFCDTTTWKDGYIDTKGNVAIEPKYYYSEPFSEGVAIVRDAVADPIFTNGACINPSKLRCAYIDTLGNNVTDFKYETLTRYLSNRGIGTYKVIHKKSVELGDTTIQIEEFSEPRFLINNRGKEVKELNFVYKYYGYSHDGIAVALNEFLWKIRKDKNYSYFDSDGNRLEPLKGLSDCQLDSLSRCNDIMQVLPNYVSISDATYFNDGFAGISLDNEHWFVIDKYLIIHGYGNESIFDDFRAFNNGLAAVKKNGKWGFVNKKIKEQIPCKYDSCGVVYPSLEEVFEYDIQGDVKKKAYINRNDSLVWESPLYKSEKIENRYSIKESKDYGKWTYAYNPLNMLLVYLIIGVIFFLVAICIIWNSVSHKSSKGEDIEELVIQRELENEVVTDANQTNVNDNDIDEILTYPTVGQYTEAIKDSAKAPDEYFDKLKNLRPVLDCNGEPIMSSGNFAVVYKMKDEHGKQYAVRCFHRAQQGRENNYKLISEELTKVSSPYLSPIKYYEKELFVESSEYPVLLMDWVEGMTLDKYIHQVIDDKMALIQLAANFRNLSIWLLSQPFAHGDLKPDNVLVKKDGSLVLVDYDGMFVPAMQGQKAREIGSPDFRNPSRTEDDFNKDIDNFPIISILLSLELLIENKDYLKQYGAEDRLLFSEEDYRTLEECTLYKRAFSSNNEDVSELAFTLNFQLCHNCSDLISILQRKEKRDKDKRTNERLENKINATIIIYNLLVPFSVFCYSRIIPEEEWNLMGVSLVALISAIILYLTIVILDIFRPYKRQQLYIDEDYTSWGCIFILMDFLIPIRGLMSSCYENSWYNTLLIIIIWICFFNIVGAIAFGSLLRNKIFLTHSEKVVEQEEREKEKVRNELRKEDELRQKRLKEIEEEKRCKEYENLPF